MIALDIKKMFGLVWFGGANATFKDISVISWRSVLLMEETGVPGENHRPVASRWAGFELTTSVVIDNECIGSCKSNYHTITTTKAPI